MYRMYHTQVAQRHPPFRLYPTDRQTSAGRLALRQRPILAAPPTGSPPVRRTGPPLWKYAKTNSTHGCVRSPEAVPERRRRRIAARFPTSVSICLKTLACPMRRARGVRPSRITPTCMRRWRRWATLRKGASCRPTRCAWATGGQAIAPFPAGHPRSRSTAKRHGPQGCAGTQPEYTDMAYPPRRGYAMSAFFAIFRFVHGGFTMFWYNK